VMIVFCIEAARYAGLPALLDVLRIMSVPGIQMRFYDTPRQRRANVPGNQFNAREFLRSSRFRRVLP